MSRRSLIGRSASRAIVIMAGRIGPKHRRIGAALLAGGLITGMAATGAVAQPAVPGIAGIRVHPNSGPGGTIVVIRGRGFEPPGYHHCIGLRFTDSGGALTELATLPAMPSFIWQGPIPAGATPGVGTLSAVETRSILPHCPGFDIRAYASFSLTGHTVSAPPTAGTRSTRQPESFQMQVRPTSGPDGTQVKARGKGFFTFLRCTRKMYFVDAAGKKNFLSDLPIAESWRARVAIPLDAAPGTGELTVEDTLHEGLHCGEPVVVASTSFTVTPMIFVESGEGE